MDAQSVLFPRVFRGYERKSVNDYILKTNRNFSEETEELKRQIETLSISSYEKSKLIDEQKEEFSALRKELDLRMKHEKELQECLDSAKSSFDSELSDILRERDEIAKKLNDIEGQYYSVKSERDQLIVEKTMEKEAKVKKLDEELTNYREKISAELRVLTKKVLIEVLSGVDSVRRDLSDLSSVSENRVNEMLGAIDDYEEEMKKEVRQIINDFNA